MMATQIYDVKNIILLDGVEVYATPLKIKYLREFMNKFNEIKDVSNDLESIQIMTECSLICMKQYRPDIKTVEEVEDVVDLETIYDILEAAAGIKFKNTEEPEHVEVDLENSDNSWENLDLAKLESEVFLIGIWKDYEDMESSLSMPELIATLNAKRDMDYSEKKFLAAIQGIDLDKESGNKKDDPWEAMKARVFSGGKTSNPDDIVSFQGVNAQKAGFGIGLGLDYEDLTEK